MGEIGPVPVFVAMSKRVALFASGVSTVPRVFATRVIPDSLFCSNGTGVFGVLRNSGGESW